MEHYVTLFDSKYLLQGLALVFSMRRHISAYTLWVLCVDEESFFALEGLALPGVRPLPLAKFETQELLRVKASRTRGEYCWTLTPYAPRFVFELAPDVSRVTYLDADVWFLKAPGSIHDEFDASGKSVLITEHAYAPAYDQTSTAGRFCVQFVTFRRGEEAEAVRGWWQDRCIEWCYARAEAGKFGDQKYLDDWPERFALVVHVLRAVERTLAPWNATRFNVGEGVLYHFHGLRVVNNGLVHLGRYRLPQAYLNQVYAPYLRDLRAAATLLEERGYGSYGQVPDATKALAYRLAMAASHEREGSTHLLPW
jgi:hypothetical protein